jgi:hypothetical protein
MSNCQCPDPTVPNLGEDPLPDGYAEIFVPEVQQELSPKSRGIVAIVQRDLSTTVEKKRDDKKRGTYCLYVH